MRMRISYLSPGLLLAGVSVACGASAQIQGGFDPEVGSFSWQIRNTGNSPIMQVEFPHFQAEGLVVPDGYTGECTNAFVAAAPAEPGVCKAVAKSAINAIRPGQTATFSLRLRQPPAAIGKGEVTLRFADGHAESVSGIELPVKPQQGFGPVPLIALGLAFAAYAIWRFRRGSRSSPPGGMPDEVI